MLLLDYAEEWFDKVIIGNHELPFLGGPAFAGLRHLDRETRRRVLELEYKGVYVPSHVLFDSYLLVHGGLAERWSFQTAQDADDVIHTLWHTSEGTTKDQPMFDWIGPPRGGKFSDECGGVMWLDWSEKRNINFNQIVGHSPRPDGPEVIDYEKSEHWNIDAGGKWGFGLGGLVFEEDAGSVVVESFLWGQRVTFTEEADGFGVAGSAPDPNDETSMWKDLMENEFARD